VDNVVETQVWSEVLNSGGQLFPLMRYEYLLAGGLVVLISGLGIAADLMKNWGELPERW
jgi:hypothetical protein